MAANADVGLANRLKVNIALASSANALTEAKLPATTLSSWPSVKRTGSFALATPTEADSAAAVITPSSLLPITSLLYVIGSARIARRTGPAPQLAGESGETLTDTKEKCGAGPTAMKLALMAADEVAVMSKRPMTPLPRVAAFVTVANAEASPATLSSWASVRRTGSAALATPTEAASAAPVATQRSLPAITSSHPGVNRGECDRFPAVN